MTLLAFALLLAVALAGAAARGGVVERKGAALFAAAWLASLGVQRLSGEAAPALWLPLIDAVVLVGLAGLAWRSPRPWPVYAAGFQTMAVAGGVARWVDPGLDAGVQLNLLAVLGFLALATLAVGAWRRPDPRQD